ncbi:hypothetical protein VNO80_10518 [Phaseolus coccineus]|uniref:non-specific serine/threonine protein kinase n=1 Tax=Phaseolus coccineus TaxID=3886 RepID=A0AAN9RDX4_PHACN
MGRYEMGKVLGEGNCSLVRLARNLVTGDKVAIKIFDKEQLLKKKRIKKLIKKKIKQEISIQNMVKHPNVVPVIEVMATKKNIYIVMEHLAQGELLDKISKRTLMGMSELQAKNYFHQLIRALDYCHSKGVFHRDIKPENLLVGDDGVLKLSDFGLSEQFPADGNRLFCVPYGTPQYTAPEVTRSYGYEGPKADIWASGVTLFFMVSGHLPFTSDNQHDLHKKICAADYTLPSFFSKDLKRLIGRMLDANPATRITIDEIFQDEWFMSNYQPLTFPREILIFDNVSASFSGIADSRILPVEGEGSESSAAPQAMNAFEMFSTCLGFNLIGNLFSEVHVKWEVRFISKSPILDIIGEIEYKTSRLGFEVKRRNFQMSITHKEELARRRGHLSIVIKIYEMVPSFYMVEVRNASGDNLQFHEFCKQVFAELQNILWKVEPLHVKDGIAFGLLMFCLSHCAELHHEYRRRIPLVV